MKKRLTKFYKMKMKPILYLLVVLALCIGGCGDKKLPEEKSASELAAE